jgi:hypothetical protein
MSFIGPTKSLNICTSQGKTFRLFITEQLGGLWIATTLFAHSNGMIDTNVQSAFSESDVYLKATEWVLNNIDSAAQIDPL